MSVPQAIVAGNLCLDLIPIWEEEGALPEPGQTAQIGAAILSTGGAASNTGQALHILGVETRLVGKVGDDTFGRVVLDLIRSRSPELAASILVAPGETTSYTIVLNLPNRDRSFLHCLGASGALHASDLEPSLLAQARLFHFGYPPFLPQFYADDGAELVRMFRSVRELGVTTSLDMTMVGPESTALRANWEAILRHTLPYVDVFLPSIGEMLLLLRHEEYEQLNRQGDPAEQVTPALLHEFSTILLDWGAKLVGFKLGARGLYLRTAGIECLSRLGRAAPPALDSWARRELWVPAFQPRQFVGATGAGDSAIAGFLAALLAGRSPEKSLRFASAVGACNVEAADALGGLCSWDETWTRLDAGWPCLPLEIHDPAWQFDPSAQIWFSTQ